MKRANLAKKQLKIRIGSKIRKERAKFDDKDKLEKILLEKETDGSEHDLAKTH